MDRKHFIRQYDEVMSDEMCGYLTTAIDCDDRHTKRVDNDIIHFSELNILGLPWHSEMVGKIVDVVRMVGSTYKKDLTYFRNFWPAKHGLEEFRVKRYNEKEDYFDTHVDVGDLNSAKRYLAFLFYLNDDFEGGSTTFLPDIEVKPKKGSVVVFPPTWQYPHRGEPVIKGTKYIMSTYYNYVNGSPNQ